MIIIPFIKNRYDCDCSIDTMTDAVRIPLASLAGMELSFEPLPTQSQSQTSTVWSIFSGNNSNATQNQVQTFVPNLKINFTVADDKECQSHEFRSSNVRFFNTVAIPIQQPEEMHGIYNL